MKVIIENISGGVENSVNRILRSYIFCARTDRMYFKQFQRIWYEILEHTCLRIKKE